MTATVRLDDRKERTLSTKLEGEGEIRGRSCGGPYILPIYSVSVSVSVLAVEYSSGRD